MQPETGRAGDRAGEPIGASSGQTLNDANLLRLRLDYGVPMVVPVAGRLIAWALAAWDGCTLGTPRRYGALALDAPAMGGLPRPWSCLVHAAPGRPRMPVRLGATVRMQSPAHEPG
jgi:hypothetical protein